MKTKVKDIMYYEEKETEYIRNCNVFDSVDSEKHVYIVFQDDGEYGYRLFRGLAYNFNDAYRIAREKVTANYDLFSCDKWLLVDPQERKEYYEKYSYNDEMASLREYYETDYSIWSFGEDGKEIDAVLVFVVKSYTETGEQ